MVRGGYKRDALAALVAQRRSKEQEVTRQLQRGISKHTSTTPNPHRKRPRSTDSSAQKRRLALQYLSEQQKERPIIPVEQNAEQQKLAKAEKKRLKNREKKQRRKLRKQSEDEARAQPLPGSTKSTPRTKKIPLPLHHSGAAQILGLKRGTKRTTNGTTNAPIKTTTTTTFPSQPSPLHQRGTFLLSDPFLSHGSSSPRLSPSNLPPLPSSPSPTTSPSPFPPSPDLLLITPSRPRPRPPLELTLTPTSHPHLITAASLLHILATRIARLNAHIAAFTALLEKTRAALKSTTTTTSPRPSTCTPPDAPPREDDTQTLSKRGAALEKMVATSARHCNEVLVMELALRDVVTEGGGGEGEALERVVGRMGAELRGMVGGYEGRMRVLMGRVSREVLGEVEGEDRGA